MRLLATSDAVLITTLILASLTPTLVALGGVIVSVVNAKKITVVHDLVNSAMTEQKRLAAMFARRAADSTHDPKDIALAEEAEAAYQRALQTAKEQALVHPIG